MVLIPSIPPDNRVEYEFINFAFVSANITQFTDFTRFSACITSLLHALTAFIFSINFHSIFKYNTGENKFKMKPEQIYQELNDLAEKLQITVSEQNFRNTGVKVQSGMCKVKGKDFLIVDKHKSIHKKIKILALHLAAMAHEDIFVVPTIRELLDRYGSD